MASGEPGTQRRDEEYVEQSVQQRPLPGGLDLHLRGQNVEQRSPGILATQQDHPGSADSSGWLASPLPS